VLRHSLYLGPGASLYDVWIVKRRVSGLQGPTEWASAVPGGPHTDSEAQPRRRRSG